MAPIMR